MKYTEEFINNLPEKVKFLGRLSHVRYNKDTYIIAGVYVEKILEGDSGFLGNNQEVLITGNTHLEFTKEYEFQAKPTIHPKYGLQYQILYAYLPIDIDNIEIQKKFLSEVLNESQIKALYETYENPFKYIQEGNIEKLMSCHGIGTYRADLIINKYQKNILHAQIMLSLPEYNLSFVMIKKLIEKYKSSDIIIKKIKENPYILIDEVNGIGFKTADKIALEAGLPFNSPIRITEFIKYYLNKCGNSGNSWIEKMHLMGALEDFIETDDYEIDFNVLGNIIKELEKEEIIWRDDKRIGLQKLYDLENNIANELKRLMQSKNNINNINWEKSLEAKEKDQGWEYTEEQKNAIKNMLENQVVMLNGSAGTGKSSVIAGFMSCIKGIYSNNTEYYNEENWIPSHYSVAICALSGKAAAKIAELTGGNGSTIHRLLGAKGYDFDFNSHYQLPHDIIIVDEISMVDGQLFYALIQAIKNSAKLIVVGDLKQLPSFGLCNIAYDIFKSNYIKIITLTKIHRQAKKSAIITESLKISKGKQILSPLANNTKEIRGELKDLHIFIPNKGELFNIIVEEFKNNLKIIDNILELQIIVPLKERGDIAVSKLNEKLQEIYNPHEGNKEERIIKNGTTFRIGDKVINRKNNYKTMNIDKNMCPIFNGNVGIIKEFSNEGVIIDFQYIDTVIVPYDFLLNIHLGYAVTTHSSQGSQYHTIIFALDMSAYTLLQRELVYTGITRAAKKCILIVENRALRHAINNTDTSIKQTFLQEFLK